jgi:hypothetical protein
VLSEQMCLGILSLHSVYCTPGSAASGNYGLAGGVAAEAAGSGRHRRRNVAW